MPNITFDVFYNTDIINFTATRSGAAPRVKPEWKVRSAPKLAPRVKVTPESAFGQKQAPEAVEDAPKPKKSIPKLPKKDAAPAKKA